MDWYLKKCFNKDENQCVEGRNWFYINTFKHTMRYFFLFLITCVIGFTSNAQQPSFYTIGSEELAGIHIYSILQDREANMWLTTENGLMRYDGYEFREYNLEGTKLSSLFGLTLDNTGVVYCHSVNGHIYRVENDSLKLYYELPDSCKWNYMFMGFDDRNHLIISCKSYYSLSPQKELKELMTWRYPRNFFLKKRDDGNMLLVDLTNDRIVSLKNGEISEFAAVPEEYKDEFPQIQPITGGKRFFGVLGSAPSVMNLDRGNISKLELQDVAKNNEKICTFVDDASRIWISYETNGVQVFDTTGRSVFGAELLFPKYRVSAFCKDREGNFWLGTFGRGILIVPSLKTIDVGHTQGFSDLNLLSMCKDSKENIYVGSQDGALFKIDANITGNKIKPHLLRKYDHALKIVNYDEDKDAIYSGLDFIDPITGKKKEDFLESVMEPIRFSNYGWLAPLNTGVLFEPDKESDLSSEIFDRFNFLKMRNGQGVIRLGRSYLVHWDPILENIWLSTSLGLKIISPKGVQEKKINGSTIYATAFFDDGEFLWVGTRNMGVLVFKGTHIVGQMTEENGLISNSIHDIKFDKGWIYFSSQKGIQRYDVQNKRFDKLTLSGGLNANNIVDFEITKRHIWVITIRGLQRIPKHFFVSSKVAPILQWDAALSNDTIPLIQDFPRLTYRQNKLYFKFHANAFHHRGELQYQYKLKGVQDAWKTLGFSQNSIVFNSLSPGTYTFLARARNEQGVFSNQIEKTFTIDPPFWETWWFYMIVILGGILLLVFFFVLRLRILKKRLIIQRELKVSEIKAIKAQMNPHFVFNALNSLQDLVMMEDIRATNIYLTRFAELMRGTLELSGRQFIPLEKEIEMLELYLQLEKLRFGDEFQFSIQSNLKKRNSEYYIPAMLLQPYVENAVKHGLLHKENDKKLIISFTDTGAGFKCEIVDNGIGRKKSAEINKRQPIKHESFAQAANESRIDLINQTLNHKIEYQIIDLEENGEGQGTIVRFNFDFRMISKY